MGKISKTLALILTLIIAVSCVTILTVKPANAQNEDTITINADGSISPPNAPIEHYGNTFVLTDNTSARIIIHKNDTVLDGRSHTVGMGSVGIGGISVGVGYNEQPDASVSYISNVTVRGFIVVGTIYGIDLVSASNVLVVNNTILETGNGIYAIQNPTAGIFVWGGNSNTIRGNTLINNYCGLNLIETTNNLITENNVLNSSFSNQLTHGGVGMAFWGASGNLIFNNNLIDNAKQVYDDSYNSPFSINSWDNGSIGNYWSDHKGNGVYVIDNKNTDHYPVTNPIDIYATPNPTSTLTPSPPSNDRNPPHLDPTYYLIPVSVIVAVIILSVLFYRRHRKTANLKQ